MFIMFVIENLIFETICKSNLKIIFIKLYKYKDLDIFFIINLIIIFLSLNIKFIYLLFHYIFYLNIDKMQFETIKFFKYEYFF